MKQIYKTIDTYKNKINFEQLKQHLRAVEEIEANLPELIRRDSDNILTESLWIPKYKEALKKLLRKSNGI